MTTTSTIFQNSLTVIETAPFVALTVSYRASLATLSLLGMTAANQVRAEAARLGLDPSVALQWIYTSLSGHPDDEFDLDVSLPATTPICGPLSDSVTVRNVPVFRCAQFTYTGSWRNLMDVYDALFVQFYANDHVYDGRVREIYRVIDMVNEENCVTDIQIGIA